MSLANIALLDKEIRELCKMARNVSGLDPVKQEFAILTCRKTAESVFEERHGKKDPEQVVARQDELNKAELILTGRLIEQMKQQNPEVHEEALMKQAETYANELRTGIDSLNRKVYATLDDFRVKFLAKCAHDRDEGFKKLTSDEGLQEIVTEELAKLPESIAKQLVEDIVERLYKKDSKSDVEVKNT